MSGTCTTHRALRRSLAVGSQLDARTRGPATRTKSADIDVSRNCLHLCSEHLSGEAEEADSISSAFICPVLQLVAILALDLGDGAVEDAVDAPGLVLTPAVPVHGQRHLQSLHRLDHLFGRTHAAHGARHDAHSAQHAFDRGGFVLQDLTSGIGDREQLLAALRRRRFDLAHVFEQAEDRVDRARAWRIGAADQLLDRLDQLIAVSRLLADQPEQERPQIAGAEKAPTATTAEFIVTAAPAAALEHSGPAVPAGKAVLAFAEPDVLIGEAAASAMATAVLKASLAVLVMVAPMIRSAVMMSHDMFSISYKRYIVSQSRLSSGRAADLPRLFRSVG